MTIEADEKTAAPRLSLSDLDYRKASDRAFDLEFVLPSGAKSGVIFKVLGSNSDRVQLETNRLVNERRKREADREAQIRAGLTSGADFVQIEDDIAFGQRLAAVRLIGWTLSDAFTTENALRLCQTNAHAAKQVMDASNNLANFTKASPKT